MARKTLNNTAQIYDFECVDDLGQRPLNVCMARNRIKEIAVQFAGDVELSDIGARLLAVVVELDYRREIAEEVMREAMITNRSIESDDE